VSASPSGATFLVHVVGAVHDPGVVGVSAGARVLDAVRAAGGALRTAELGLVNLARPVVDGEQIRIPAHGETLAPAPPVGQGPASSQGTGGAGGAGSAAVDLNTADTAALEALPGVGPVIAGRIVQWRTSNGRFTSVDELAEIQGIGDRLLEGLRGLVTVS
jgi:competence protein ComEA